MRSGIGIEAMCTAQQGPNNQPLGGTVTGMLSAILSFNNRIDLIDDMLSTVETCLLHPNIIHDDYKIDGVLEVFIYNGKLIYGPDDSATSSDNDFIPLSDAKALLLEWRDFVISKP
jgi:hypothetical protein